MRLLDFIFLNLNKQRVEIEEAREYYKESGDVEGTLRQLPRYLVAERAIVSLLLFVLSPSTYFFHFDIADVWKMASKCEEEI